MKNTHLSRRSFLQHAGLAAGVLALPGIFRSLPRAKDRLGVALVGLGYYSTDVLAPALQLTKHCYLAGIVTGTPAKAVRWQQQYNIPEKNIYDYNSFDRIADNPDIDVIYIVLPPSMHAEYSIRAAKAGKHVWCEKPMATTAAECEAMIRAARNNKVTLAIGYRMQHEPNTRELMRLVREKTLGAARRVTTAAGYRESRADHWKMKKAMGGGAMYDMGVYALQGARYSTGEEPIAVTAQHSTTRPELFTEVDETTTFRLEFPSGAIAECETSFGKGLNNLEASYEKGWARLQPFQAYNGVQGATNLGPLDARIDNQQARQMDDDAMAIMQRKPLLVPGEEGLRDIRIVEAIYRSARSGKRVKL